MADAKALQVLEATDLGRHPLDAVVVETEVFEARQREDFPRNSAESTCRGSKGDTVR